MNFRSIHRSRTILGSILLALCCLPQLLAQTDPALETGLKPFGSYQGSDIDFVSTTTGRLHVHIPLFSVPQLGGRLHADYFVLYDSAAYSYFCPPPPATGCANIEIQTTPWMQTGAWVQTDAVPAITQTDLYNDPGHDLDYSGTIVSVLDPEGAAHRMGAFPAGAFTTQMQALDASGYSLSLNQTNWYYPTVYDANGNNYNTSTGVMHDAIGNSMTAPLFTRSITSDTLGRSIPAPPQSQGGALCPNWSSWQVPGNSQNGGTVTYQLCFAQVGLQTVLSKIELPNHTYYTFSYEAVTVDGRQGLIVDLTEIQLPTGGSISYTWASELSGCGTSQNHWRRVATRTVNDGNGHQWTWNYSRSGTVFTITDPLNNVAVHTGTLLNNETCSLYETQYQQKDNAGNTLRTVTTAYASSNDPGGRDYVTYDVLAVVPTSVETQYGSSLQAWTAKTYPSNTFTFCDLAQSPGHHPSCASEDGGEGSAIYIGNPSQVCVNDYNYGSTCPGTLRTTTNTGVPGDSCTSRDEANWYERSLAWHEERNIRRNRL